MALNHPLDSPPHPSHDPISRREGPHPAVSLIAGFGLIVVGATLIHIVFNVLV